jgi:hypothetical protein
MQTLLIDRSIMLLMASNDKSALHKHFACVHPGLIGSQQQRWTVLTGAECVRLFGPQNDGQARLQ